MAYQTGQTAQQTDEASTSAMGGSSASPVDDRTFNVLQALTSTLESIDAYGRYAADGDGDLFGRLIEEERGHAELLLEALRTRLDGAHSR